MDPGKKLGPYEILKPLGAVEVCLASSRTHTTKSRHLLDSDDFLSNPDNRVVVHRDRPS